MTPLQSTLGWVATVMFFRACWLMGAKSSSDRRDGIFAFILVNAGFAMQAFLTHNWPLLTMSVCGVLLHLRAWVKWEHHDAK